MKWMSRKNEMEKIRKTRKSQNNKLPIKYEKSEYLTTKRK